MFGETIDFGRLLRGLDTPSSRLALLAENLEGTIATVFRQVAMNRFEELVHTARREQGELSVERFGELWARARPSCWATRWRSPTATASWWSYIPHFINTPGYVYAYAYGQLLASPVYERYEQRGRGVRAALPRAARRGRLAPPRGARRGSSTSISPTPASGTRGWISWSASWRKPKRPRRRWRASEAGRCAAEEDEPALREDRTRRPEQDRNGQVA